MVNIQLKDDCCGCTACASICAHNAITMMSDALGFLYPKVDMSKCVDCGLCEKVCQFNNDYDHSLNFHQPIAYAARHKNTSEIMKSRSGAAFVAISDKILEQHGVVYGVGYKDHFRVAHKRAITKEERNEFRGSKYVQSDLTGVFRQVREDLRNGLVVLFSGTPCQTSGLKSFVEKKLLEKLYLIDIACHGVPGPYIWRDYITYLEKKHNSSISLVNFRDKENYGWGAHKESFMFEYVKEKRTFDFRFYQNIFFRPSCSKCYFTNLQRPSDITIADFWGWQKSVPTMNSDNKGVSLVLCNTQKGLLLFKDIMSAMDVVSVELKDVKQRAFDKPVDISCNRDKFYNEYEKRGFEKTMKKYGLMGWKFYTQQLFNRLNRKYRLLLKRIR